MLILSLLFIDNLTLRQTAQRSRRLRERSTCADAIFTYVPHNSRALPALHASYSERTTRRRKKKARAAFNDERPSSSIPLARQLYSEPFQAVSFGEMNIVCSFCKALHWAYERVKGSAESTPRFSHCCHGGKIQLEQLPHPPPELERLFNGSSSQSSPFKKRIRQYNAALAFTSFVTEETHEQPQGRGPPIWKTGYTIYHSASSLIPPTNERPTLRHILFPASFFLIWFSFLDMHSFIFKTLTTLSTFV